MPLYIRLRKDFKQLLEETGYVTPGKQLDEVNTNINFNMVQDFFSWQVRVLFMGRECFESLPETELHQIYQLHQQVQNH